MVYELHFNLKKSSRELEKTVSLQSLQYRDRDPHRICNIDNTKGPISSLPHFSTWKIVHIKIVQSRHGGSVEILSTRDTLIYTDYIYNYIAMNNIKIVSTIYRAPALCQ